MEVRNGTELKANRHGDTQKHELHGIPSCIPTIGKLLGVPFLVSQHYNAIESNCSIHLPDDGVVISDGIK